LAGIFLVTGCRERPGSEHPSPGSMEAAGSALQEESPPHAAEAPGAGRDFHEPATSPGSSGAAQASAAPALSQSTPPVDLDTLTQALRRYSAEKRRLPSSLNEVVAAGYLKVLPPPPPGMRYAINPARVEVVLVKQ